MKTKHIHMMGVCGTGMGSLALLLKEVGYHVTGSDENVYPPMSTQLENAGVKAMSGYKPANLLAEGKYPDQVIVGNVISRGNLEVEEMLAKGISYLSMPQAVSEFFLKGKHSIVVTGTHGKTTTSTLCAWLLESAGLDPSFLIGGVGINLRTSAKIGKGNYFVIEGDEYDTAFFDKGPKFLHYQPKSVIMGPIEFDHADIYRDLAHVMSSFEKLVDIMPKDGLLMACADSKNTMEISNRARCRCVTYGMSADATYHPVNIKISGEGTEFDLKNVQSSHQTTGGQARFKVPMWGEHNLQNIVGVLGLLIELGINPKKLEQGLKTFEGIKRRQEVRGVVNDITVIDDFAHHPTAIFETIKAMRFRFPKSKIWSIFEPRSNTSKRNIFQKDYVNAFKDTDVAIIAGVHRPDKVAEGDRLNLPALIEDMNQAKIKAYNFNSTDEIVDFVRAQAKSGDVVLIMSNGGFDNIHEKILKRLK